MAKKLKKISRAAFRDVRHKYRLSVTDENFHEKLSFKFSSLNIWVLLISFTIAVIVATAAIVVFTPVRRLVPGYIKKELVQQSLQDRMRLDSLQMRIEAQETILKVLGYSLGGQIAPEESVVIHDSLKQYGNIAYRRSIQDSLLRWEIEHSDRYAVEARTSYFSGYEPGKQSFSNNLIFYTPVIGTPCKDFNLTERHYGIDMETADNAVVKAVLDGNTVFTSWSPEWGYILVMEHENRLISIYCSCSALFKRTGEFVKAGEAIGITGPSREYARHNLHFELWYNGTPVDPAKYLLL